MLSNLAIGAIAVYQRWASPRKGFACAHRILHGDRSCSQFAREVCRQQGFFVALRRLRSRFAECRRAAIALKAQSSSAATDKEAVEPTTPTAAPGVGFEFAKDKVSNEKPNKAKSTSSNSNCLDGGCTTLACGLESCDLLEACGGIAACG
jgi:putative component of membrane protein insertase Oxa1/YidC/SpoIIIJ protein YidD